jgi:hypothetical protein
VPVPPKTAPALCDCVVLPSLGIIAQDAAAPGAEALRAVTPKSVEKNSVRIPTKPFFHFFKTLIFRAFFFNNN